MFSTDRVPFATLLLIHHQLQLCQLPSHLLIYLRDQRRWNSQQSTYSTVSCLMAKRAASALSDVHGCHFWQHHLFPYLWFNDSPLLLLQHLHIVSLVEVVLLIAAFPKIWAGKTLKLNLWWYKLDYLKASWWFCVCTPVKVTWAASRSSRKADFSISKPGASICVSEQSLFWFLFQQYSHTVDVIKHIWLHSRILILNQIRVWFTSSSGWLCSGGCSDSSSSNAASSSTS